MTRLIHRQEPDAPLLHVVDGKQVVSGNYNLVQRFGLFLLEPFTGAWRHRDLIAAILRRELRERFSGSVARRVWAVVAPLISLVTYTGVRRRRSLPQRPGKFSIDCPLRHDA
jgi:lipopolysaccharide transport system permease protein